MDLAFQFNSIGIARLRKMSIHDVTKQLNRKIYVLAINLVYRFIQKYIYIYL